MAAQRAERAKNDRMSGRELFLSDSSWFVDDVEAYDEYQREEQSDEREQKANVNSSTGGPSTSTYVGDAEDNEEDDDNELDQDELMTWKQA